MTSRRGRDVAGWQARVPSYSAPRRAVPRARAHCRHGSLTDPHALRTVQPSRYQLTNRESSPRRRRQGGQDRGEDGRDGLGQQEIVSARAPRPGGGRGWRALASGSLRAGSSPQTYDIISDIYYIFCVNRFTRLFFGHTNFIDVFRSRRSVQIILNQSRDTCSVWSQVVSQVPYIVCNLVFRRMRIARQGQMLRSGTGRRGVAQIG